MIRLANKLIKYAYSKTTFAQKDILDKIALDEPQFYQPLANAELLLSFEKIFAPHQLNGFPKDLTEALTNAVSKETITDESFDFSKISSLTNSKGFANWHRQKINGNWFNNIAEWGQAMYHDSNLSGLSKKDFDNNVHHIEVKEGFKKNHPINVSYYSWIDRYIGDQSGGSHHSAMLAKQLTEKDYSYHRQAIIKSYQLRTEQLKALSDSYYMFIVNEKAYYPEFPSSKASRIFSKFLCEELYQITLKDCCKFKATICFVPKNKLIVDSDVFANWYQKQVSREVIYDLLSFMEEPLKYLTTAYLHKLDYVRLGDPERYY